MDTSLTTDWLGQKQKQILFKLKSDNMNTMAGQMNEAIHASN